MCTRSQAKKSGVMACSEMGADPALWSTEAPMAPPQWVRDSFQPMCEAIILADAGELGPSITRYRQDVPDRALNEWFDSHAQYSYKWRCTDRGIPRPDKIAKEDMAPRLGGPESRLPLEVFARDSYRCRYCDMPLISVAAFRRFEDRVGDQVFALAKRKGNQAKPGAALVFRPVADQVEPWSRGGATDLGNLVASCWPCNFGKMAYTVEELGISDPRSRPSVADGWNGLRVPAAG